MPYIILALGAAVGLYGLYRFIVLASIRQIMAFLVVVASIGILLGVFYMTVSGRLLPVVGLLAALWPVLFALYTHHKKKEAEGHTPPPSNKEDPAMTRAEALDILGLKEDKMLQIVTI